MPALQVVLALLVQSTLLYWYKNDEHWYKNELHAHAAK